MTNKDTPTDGRAVTNCPIREHSGDGGYVGRCEFAIHDAACPRHGFLADYPTLDDREVDPSARRFPKSQPKPWRKR